MQSIMQKLRTILKSNQWAKRWLYLFNPSSINQMLKKKKNENNNSYSNSHKILFLI